MIDSLDGYFNENIKNLYILCVERQELEAETGLDPSTLKRNTDHLIWRGDLYQFGKRGGRDRKVRYSQPLDMVKSVLSVPIMVALEKKYPEAPSK